MSNRHRDGNRLWTDEADGAWESGYEWIHDDEAWRPAPSREAREPPRRSRASATTRTVIADTARGGNNLVGFWRDDIPSDFEQRPGTKSRRIADQVKITISQLTTEPSANVLGYGVAVINGSFPDPVATPGFPNAFTAGVTRPAPRGVQQFIWNPDDRRFLECWINNEVDNSDIMVPVVSAATGLMYCAHKDHGDYQYVGLDWVTGELKQRWIFPDDSRLWNACGGITTVLDNGDLLIGGAFAIKRLSAEL